MNTLLLTAYNATMAPIGDLTSPLMLAYANRHGFDFKCARIFQPDCEPYWQKIWEIMRAFSRSNPVRKPYDRIIWVDADMVVTNMDFVPPWHTGFQASLDWGSDAVDESMFSMCAFVVGADMEPLIAAIANDYEAFKDCPFPEQTAARAQYVSDREFKYRMRTHHRRIFNSVPREISEEAPDPWQPGDWLCHLTHVGVSRRAELFHEIIKQAYP